MKRVGIDLTPVLPGGENGGAKTLALELVKQLASLAPSTEFLLLTASGSHAELASLDGANVRRICVIEAAVEGAPANRQSIVQRAGRKAPAGVKRMLAPAYEWLVLHAERRRNLKHLGLNLLFCPFTAPFLASPGVPVVAVVHDLQFAAYPQFFSDRELSERKKSFSRACTTAKVLVCPSEYVKSRVLALGVISEPRVKVIHNTPDRRGSAIETYAPLKGVRYLLYPANYWPHKNHEMLLTAYGMFVHSEREAAPHLVLTGSPGEREQRLREAAEKMGLGERVHFAGYLSDDEYLAVLGGCEALVFPSLYEGFGMPILEAMRSGKPVLCSNVTSLPEVAGEAAVLFDPRNPWSIAEAMRRVADDAHLRQRLAREGARRVDELGSSETMARRYLNTFEEALN